MQKGTILKLGAVAVVAIALGAYIIWDKQHASLANAPATVLLGYSSEEGVYFNYPNSYRLASTNQHVGSIAWDSTDFVNNTEKISLSIFPDTGNLSLLDFVKTKPQSYYALSQDGTLTSGTIGGEPSVAYQYRVATGSPYYSDAVAVLHNNRVYIFSDTWTQTVDPIRHDFNDVLSSVQFQ